MVNRCLLLRPPPPPPPYPGIWIRLYLQTVFDAGVENSKLEKVEIGGLKGGILGQKVEELFEEFKTIFSGFTKIEYDALNPDDDAFERDERAFRANVKDLEGRLAAIITQAFGDCANFESLSKVKIGGGGILNPCTYVATTN